MKKVRDLWIVPALLLMTGAAYADSVMLASYGTSSPAPSGVVNGALVYNGFVAQHGNGVNPGGSGSSYSVSPASVWAEPIGVSSWVTNSATGGPPNGDGFDAPMGDYFYTTTFNLDSTKNWSGTLSALADDTMQVWLNGHMLMDFGSLGSDGHCADVKPNCGYPGQTAFYELTVPILNSYLADGLNTVTLIDWQSDPSTPAGVDFEATMVTPEPGSLLLLGTGLLGMARVIFRRARTSRG